MTSADRTETIEAIANSLRTILRARSADAPWPWLHLDLTLPQIKVLMLLDSVGTARPTEIAEAIGASSNGMTGILDRLSERALIHRAPDVHDRRALRVGLEPAGEAVLDEIHAAGQSQVARLLHRVDDLDLQAFRQGIEAVARQLPNVPVESVARVAIGVES